mmetsp:Transcript_7628/g.11572  ORF Transcript_7628/g.11572 Transcript_7628/m.11572 type:complete len:274 (+) Transcript_7628:56-877(+)
MMKSLGASAILLAASTSSCNAFFFSTTTTNRPSSSSLAATPILGPINEDIFSTTPPLRIEGNSLKTWSGFQSDRVQVSIKSMGRPVEASVELWQTPSYIPTKFTVECEDGSENIVHSLIELPPGYPVTIAVYNTEGQEFPMEVSVSDSNSASALDSFAGWRPILVQGDGTVKAFNLADDVEHVEILLTTQTRNMKAYIEILKGPNDDNEIIEVDTDNAYLHPFYTVIQAAEGCNTLRIKNENSVEFPFEAYVRPCEGVVEEERQQFNYGGPYF